MRFMIMVRANADTEAGRFPPDADKLMADMAAYHEELARAGALLDGSGPRPSSEGFRIRWEGGRQRVIDGPYAESKELVAGFSIWQVRDMNEALAWVKRAPLTADSIMEILPFYEAEDLAGFVTPEELATPRSGERGKLGVA